jgi:hypothetical protein
VESSVLALRDEAWSIGSFRKHYNSREPIADEQTSSPALDQSPATRKLLPRNYAARPIATPVLILHRYVEITHRTNQASQRS